MVLSPSINASCVIAVVFAGIVFPTCVSLNYCVCHFSPLRSDTAVTLKNGDLVKV